MFTPNEHFQAVIIRGHCRLMAVGMTHSRLTKTQILAMAGSITGVTYKRGQHSVAATDLTTMIDRGKQE